MTMEKDSEDLRHSEKTAEFERPDFEPENSGRDFFHARDVWKKTFDAIPELVSIMDKQHRIVRMNAAMGERLNLDPDKAEGLTCYEHVHGMVEPPPFCPHSELLICGRRCFAEIYEERLNGHFAVSVSPIHDAKGRLIGSVHVATDITQLKETEKALEEARTRLEQAVDKRTTELLKANEKMRHEIGERKQTEKKLIENEIRLKEKKDQLVQMNTALEVLLDHRDKERKSQGEDILSNVKKLVFPYIEKLQEGVPNDRLKTYLDIIKTNLENIVSPFAGASALGNLDLTPAEMQVAGLIRQGYSTKAISSIINISSDAVSFHRKNIRRKLGLTKKKTNLRSYLQRLAR